MRKLTGVLALLVLGVTVMASKARAADSYISRNEIVLSSAVIGTNGGIRVFNGAGAVYGVTLSSGAVANYVVLRDSNTANTSSPELLPRLMFITGAAQNLTFVNPLRIYNGLVVQQGNATANEGFTVYYRQGKLP